MAIKEPVLHSQLPVSEEQRLSSIFSSQSNTHHSPIKLYIGRVLQESGCSLPSHGTCRASCPRCSSCTARPSTSTLGSSRRAQATPSCNSCRSLHTNGGMCITVYTVHGLYMRGLDRFESVADLHEQDAMVTLSSVSRETYGSLPVIGRLCMCCTWR